MSKVIKKVGKAVKSVVKGVKKVFKEITSSKIGRGLLIAATVAVGGAALGFWSIPKAIPLASKINGAFVSGAKTAGATAAKAGSTNAIGAGTVNAGTALGKTAASTGPGFSVGNMASTASMPAATNTAGFTLGGTAAKTAPSMMSATAPSLASGMSGIAGGGAASAGASTGLLGKIGAGVKSAGNFVQENPVISMMGLNAAAAMAAPDELDMLREQQRLLDEDRERREKNLNVAGIDLGISASRKPLTFLNSGQPVFSQYTGLIGPKSMGS